MLGKTIGWWVAMVVALSASMGCNAILGWDFPDAGEPRSCAQIESTCGVGEAEGHCCASLIVAGGKPTDGGDSFKGFRLDTYEVTVGRFKAFLADPNHKNEINFDGCPGATHGNEDGDDLPINCVTIAVAQAFCDWDDKGRLPTSIQFQRAAMEIETDPEMDPMLPFPWGPEPSPSEFENYVTIRPSPVRSVGAAAAGQGGYGQFDLLGNVREWVDTGVVYGRSYEDDMDSIRPFSSRFTTPPPPPMGETMTQHSTIGFRCARDL